MTQQYKTGDIVKVLRVGTAGTHMKGVTTRVVEGNEDGSDFVYVEDPTGGGLFTQYGDTTSWIIDNDNLELVEEALADWEKELLGIETKQEETVAEFKVGDKVRVLEKSIWHSKGETGEVEEVHDDGSVQVNNWWLSPQNVELVEPKAVKARSQEIKLEDVQKDDLLVCFWQVDGVETRKKGIAHENDGDDDWFTEEGAYLTYDDELGDVGHIYLIERPEVKEPELADGTYWVTSGGYSGWRVEVTDETAKWFYELDDTLIDNIGYEFLIRVKRGEVHGQKLLTEAPSDAYQTELDKMGVKPTNLYRQAGIIYQFLGDGKVRTLFQNNPYKTYVLEPADVEAVRSGEYELVS